MAERKCCNELLRHAAANYACLFMGHCVAGRNVTATLIESQLYRHNMRLVDGGGGAGCHDTFITNELWDSIGCCLTSTD